MNIKNTVTILTLTGLIAFASGCKKNEPATPNVAPGAPAATLTPAAPAQAATDAAAQLTNAAPPAVDQAAAATAAAAQQAQTTAKDVTQQGAAAAASIAPSAPAVPAAIPATVPADSTNKVQVVVAQAKDYVAQNKYPLALKTLQKLDGMKLSPKEQSVVDGLKKQVEKKMATDATKSVTDLLK